MIAGRFRITTILVALTLFGCKGSQTSAAGVTGGPATAPAASSSLDGGTRSQDVPDTTLNNMPAYSVTLPAKWTLQGVVMQGGPATCDSYAFPVWRAASPDGLSYVEQMPQIDVYKRQGISACIDEGQDRDRIGRENGGRGI